MKLTKYLMLFGVLLLAKVVVAQTFQLPDAGFKTCLVDKKPEVLDANQNLIVAEAQTATGYLSCRGYNIANIDGVQYFEQVREIDFSSNSITSISAFVPSDSLLRLRLNDNELSTLPNLSALPQLRTLEVKRNKLVNLPDLSSNKILIQLYVEGNELTTIPSLDSLKNLYAINVSDNNLTAFPEMDSLKSLVEIKAQRNALTSFPSLEKLPILKEVFLSGNNLSALPKVAANNQIKTVDIRANQFTTLPDFTVFPVLNRALLDNNALTFEDLMPLTSIVGYDTIFPLKEQQILLVGNNYSVRKNEVLNLSTGVDESVAEVKYSWFYNGNLVQEMEEDLLKAKTDSVTDSGYYYAQLSHPSFPNLSLQTDSFYVQVNPCFIHEDIVVEVMPRTCKNNGGQVLVSSDKPMPNTFVYQLVATRTSQELYSETGVFTNLGETEYVLYGAVDNCRESIGGPIEIKVADCNNAYITVDGDGNNDVYYINEEGNAQVYDKFGNSVANIDLPGQWDGMSKGQKVAPGLYYININDGEKVVKITVVH